MSHPKNTTTTLSAQLPKLSPISFGPEYDPIFSIGSDVDLVQGLDIAADLGNGVSQLCGRLDSAINEGEVVLCSEVRAIGFLADVISALTRSAQISLKKSTEVGGAQ